jgi:hypothetical protein
VKCVNLKSGIRKTIVIIDLLQSVHLSRENKPNEQTRNLCCFANGTICEARLPRCRGGNGCCQMTRRVDWIDEERRQLANLSFHAQVTNRDRIRFWCATYFVLRLYHTYFPQSACSSSVCTFSWEGQLFETLYFEKYANSNPSIT